MRKNNKVTVSTEDTKVPSTRIYRHRLYNKSFFLVINVKDGERLVNLKTGNFWSFHSLLGSSGHEYLEPFHGTLQLATG